MNEFTNPDFAARRQALSRAILRRMLAHVAAGGTTDLAAEPLSMPASVYTDPQRFAAEKRVLFSEWPLLACLSGDVPERGDTRLFEETGTPILIVRGADGCIRAFLNMCMHRGAKLVAECSRKTVLSCPFHGWSYNLEGKLKGVPGRVGFEGVDLSQRGLIRVPAAEWNGLVFVRPSPGDETLDIAAFLGNFGPELMQLELDGARPVKSGVLKAQANWKYVMDTYGESYHFASLHRDTIAQVYTSNIGCYEPFGRNFRLLFPSKEEALLAGKPESEWPEVEYNGLHFLFPNTMFFIGSVGGGKPYIQIFRLFPGATIGEMHCNFSVYAAAGETSEAYRAEVATAFDGTYYIVDNEDYPTAARAWANLATAPTEMRVIIGRNEIALQDYQRNVADVIGIPLG